jgi:hypothetical protein
VYRLFPTVRSLPFHPDTLTLTERGLAVRGLGLREDRRSSRGLLMVAVSSI